MGLPPSFAGAVNATMMSALPAIAVTPVGASGAVGALTTWSNSASLALNVSFPGNVALMVCQPCDKAFVVHEACPLASSGTAGQMIVAHSAKVTVPLGAPVAPVTDALKVTLWPAVEGFALLDI